MLNPSISIIILNWNGINDTLVCLNCLKKFNYPNFDVIVVDNGSTDNSLTSLNDYNPPYPFTVIPTGRNLGYAGGNNIGIRHAIKRKADFIFLLNNDTIVAPNILEELVYSAHNNPATGIFGALIFYMNKPDIIWFAGAHWNKHTLAFDYPYQNETVPSNIESNTDYACGAAFFFRAEVTDSIGLLDERFFLVYEESDWCRRAINAGFECMLVSTAHVWHKIGASFETENSPLRQYFSFRNRLLWAEKNLSRPDWFRILASSFKPFLPKFHFSSCENRNFIKRLFWATVSYNKTWFSPVLRARRRGILDYLLRNFGDCPDMIRNLNKIDSSNKKIRST
ncbi:glycosyltransferase family 2 protein [Methylomonas sp. MgM2]